MSFLLNRIPSQKGKTAIVTGANIGLGYETALALTKKDCTVIMACRNQQKAEKAMTDILQEVPKADLHFIHLDLSSLNSVRKFASNFLSQHGKLDLLINNAGIMIPPYSKTEDGFESQMGANYFGHFLLTNLLFPTLNKTDNARIVSLANLAHDWGNIYFDDIHFEKTYNARKAYGQSKLACLMFSYELDRRLRRSESDVISVAAHPGASNTNLMQHFPPLLHGFVNVVSPIFLSTPKGGVLPTLRAALDPSVKGGEYYGPGGFREMKGNPVKVESNRASKNEAVAKRLWKVSEELTGAKFEV